MPFFHQLLRLGKGHGVWVRRRTRRRLVEELQSDGAGGRFASNDTSCRHLAKGVILTPICASMSKWRHWQDDDDLKARGRVQLSERFPSPFLRGAFASVIEVLLLVMTQKARFADAWLM